MLRNAKRFIYVTVGCKPKKKKATSLNWNKISLSIERKLKDENCENKVNYTIKPENERKIGKIAKNEKEMSLEK